MINLKDLQREEIEQLLISMGQPKFRGKQIFGWLYKNIDNFDEMTNLPVSLRGELVKVCHMGILKPELIQVSKIDGTRKYLFTLEDGNAIESVLMKYKYGNSICISSQAGCRMGCTFCASGINGLQRNLTAGEMIGQVLAAEKDSGEKINHIVIMGTGEPFDNFENLSAFLKIVHDKDGLNLSLRNITVSTCGIVPMIHRFGHEFPQVNLAISLHGSNDRLRSEIMPINKAYPIRELMGACREYSRITSRRITFEYTLVKGVNDGREQAKELIELLRGMLCHVNLIPLNKVEETGLDTTGRKDAEAFCAYLQNHGIPATIRRELGDDIDGACGQLRLKKQNT